MTKTGNTFRFICSGNHYGDCLINSNNFYCKECMDINNNIIVEIFKGLQDIKGLCVNDTCTKNDILNIISQMKIFILNRVQDEELKQNLNKLL